MSEANKESYILFLQTPSCLLEIILFCMLISKLMPMF